MPICEFKLELQSGLSWALTFVTLIFDLWPWPFAWTSLLSLVITENFMMIRWWEHIEKGVTDKRTVWQTDGWTIHRAAWSQLKTIGYLISVPSSFLHYFVTSLKSNCSYSPETLNSGQNRRFFGPCDCEMWWMTYKNNRAPILYPFKRFAVFCRHPWIKTGVTVRKRPNWDKIRFDLYDMDLWPWPIARTSLLLMVITLENFMMVRWRKHGEKLWQTDERRDGRTEPFTELLGCS